MPTDMYNDLYYTAMPTGMYNDLYAWTVGHVFAIRPSLQSFQYGVVSIKMFWSIRLCVAETNDSVLKIINAPASWAEAEVCYLFISFIYTYTVCFPFQENFFLFFRLSVHGRLQAAVRVLTALSF